jgi:hypothetical protein
MIMETPITRVSFEPEYYFPPTQKDYGLQGRIQFRWLDANREMWQQQARRVSSTKATLLF